MTPPLRMFFWETTAGCNLACAHCRRIDTDTGGELTTAEAKTVIDTLPSLGSPVLVFSGGEPLLRADLFELAKYAKSLKIKTALATNGTLINEALAKQIAAAGFHRVSISLDGTDAKTHDTLRRQDGAFDAALRGQALLHAVGVPTQFNATLTTESAHQLPELYDLAVAKQAIALHLFLLVPVGCGAEIESTHQLSAARYEELLAWILDHRDGPLELRPTCAPHYYRLAAEQGIALRGKGCLAGQAICFLSHTGEIFPCGYLPLSAGNVRETSLPEIWNSAPLFADLRNPAKLLGKCSRCQFATVCGGCRARAYGQTGNPMTAEPFCSHNPKAGE